MKNTQFTTEDLYSRLTADMAGDLELDQQVELYRDFWFSGKLKDFPGQIGRVCLRMIDDNLFNPETGLISIDAIEEWELNNH